MITRLLTSAQIDLAAQLLSERQLVAFPTDTVYGLGALAFAGLTALRLYVAKDRPPEKAIPILMADIADLDRVAIDVPPIAYQLMARFWPGALTIVVPRHPDVPIEVSATETVAVRIPDLDLARALMRLTGPLAVTSANRSSGPNPRTAQEVLAQLDGRIDAIIDGGSTSGGVPSTVLDCTQAVPRMLRAGALADDVAAFLRQAV
ncbi:MAG TPA: L-threonylcarbamoyladenylate synthase [Anaerolineae bacterium]|nr:L-threonylcarbamoyladenylate synthase [Anaerolineae bacterium]